VLRLGTRLVFAAANGDRRAPQVLTAINRGTGPLAIADLAITGAQAARFALAPGQPTRFSVPAGASAPIAVVFVPPVGAAPENTAVLTMTTSDPARATVSVPLSGVHAAGYEGGQEPTLQAVLRTLGYTTSVGTEGHYIASGRTPAVNERISPAWVAADPTRATQLVPVARYTGLVASCQCAKTGWRPRGGDKAQLHYFVGGTNATGGPGNETVLPQYVGSTSFLPGAGTAFTLYTNSGESSDDGYNTNHTHVFRFYAARDAAGAVIPDTWLAVNDQGLTPTNKNWDYQDGVFLLVNARPELSLGAFPGSPATVAEFAAPVAGTVADAQGEGTGLRYPLPSRAGGRLRPELLDLAGGRLAVRSTAGTFTGATGTQDDAVGFTFDGSRRRVTVDARLVGPGPIDAGDEHAGLWFGPDEDNHVRFAVQNRGGVPHLVAWYEARSTVPDESVPDGRLLGTPVSLASVAGTAATVDLRLVVDPGGGRVTPAYRINDGAWTTWDAAAVPNDVSRWFSVQSHTGIVTSNAGGSPFTATYDWFRVGLAS
jgi:hypothetical protein